MITLNIGKAICPVCDVKNSNRVFRWKVANWQLWGSFLLKIKTEQKRKLDSFLFYQENNFKTFKKLLGHPSRESVFKDPTSSNKVLDTNDKRVELYFARSI